MALVIYSNGIAEEMLPLNDTFTDDELVGSFNMYESIKSHRLSEIPNCWCVWGFISNPPEHEFNKLASEIADEDVHSHLIFVHDSELNMNWGITDSILYKSYSTFMKQVGDYIKEMVKYIANEVEKEYENADTTSMIFLRAVGHTADKRVLYVFNPDEQSENFYVDGWDKFSFKIYVYLKENFDKEPVEENKPFVIYSDSKTIVIVEDKYVNEVVGSVLQFFERVENYEACSYISSVRERWYTRKTLPDNVMDPSIGPIKKKRGRPPKDVI